MTYPEVQATSTLSLTGWCCNTVLPGSPDNKPTATVYPHKKPRKEKDRSPDGPGPLEIPEVSEQKKTSNQKPDISTLVETGHFYFGLTPYVVPIDNSVSFQ
jgi:hypothetical protein